MLTEREIFFSNQPQLLLSPYSYDQLSTALGYYNFQNLNELIDYIYKKYHHISLLTWDLPTFYDYATKSVISLDQLNHDFNKYSPMALQKLGLQLKSVLQDCITFSRECDTIIQLYKRINDQLNEIAMTNYIVE